MAIAKSSVPGEDMGGEVRHADPGKDKEPIVVGDEGEVLTSKRGGTADGAIAGFLFPDRETPSEGGQQSSIRGMDKVFEPFSRQCWGLRFPSLSGMDKREPPP